MSRQAPRILRTVRELREQVAAWKANGERVGLVPTMGALHDGHMALHAHARANARRTITSIFVNPTQFSPSEDFSRYPRTFDDDIAKLAAAGCDAVWAPLPETMYPAGFATEIHISGPADDLETAFRPHFFRGVALVCCKLFTQTQADFAMFGEKDYQQLAVVRRMAADLDLPIEVIAHPTIREADGLAMSSRNAYLSDQDRAIAPRLKSIMGEAVTALASGRTVLECEKGATQALIGAGFQPVDYVAIRDSITLEPVSDETAQSGRPVRILTAAWLGETRLIDNMDATILAGSSSTS